MERSELHRQIRKGARTPIDDVDAFVDDIQDAAVPIRDVRCLEPLIESLKDSRVVMLGEASHGTQEYYEWRRLISSWLITRHGFDFIVVEGDWPSSETFNRYVLGEGDGTAMEALRTFRRWPTWMWANTEVARLGEWMRSHNSRSERKATFHGLDVYSLFESIDAVEASAEKVGPHFARRIRQAYGCFDPFRGDERQYARSLIGNPAGCEEEAARVARLLEEAFRKKVGSEPAAFDAIQNARVVRNAEAYYRAMIFGDEDSWNVRDRHMLDTLEALLESRGPDSRAIVWAHNTHIGDYRATDMRSQGLVNLGGLAREKWGTKAVSLVGFGSHRGEVIASHAWAGPIQRMIVPEAREGTTEAAFHEAATLMSEESFYVLLRDRKEETFRRARGHRAIGVVYDPDHERHGNYVPTSLSERYDAFVWFDRTRALVPILPSGDFDARDIPETWPRGQ
jgi:erythromycin esterase-like protein